MTLTTAVGGFARADAGISCGVSGVEGFLADVQSSCGRVGLPSNWVDEEDGCGSTRNHRQCVEQVTDKASRDVRAACQGVEAEKCPSVMQPLLSKYNAVEQYHSCIRNLEISACNFKRDGSAQKKLQAADVKEARAEVIEQREEMKGSAQDMLDAAYAGLANANKDRLALQARNPPASAAELAAAEARVKAASDQLGSARRAIQLARNILKDGKSTKQETERLKAELAKMSGSGNAFAQEFNELRQARQHLREEKRDLRDPTDKKTQTSLRDQLTRAEVKKERVEGNREIKEARDSLRTARSEHNPLVDKAAKDFETAKAALTDAKKAKVDQATLNTLENNKNVAAGLLRSAVEKRDLAVTQAETALRREQKEKSNELARAKQGDIQDTSNVTKPAREAFRADIKAAKKDFADANKERRDAYVKERTDASVVEERLSALRADPQENAQEIARLEEQLKTERQEEKQALNDLRKERRENIGEYREARKAAAGKRDDAMSEARRAAQEAND